MSRGLAWLGLTGRSFRLPPTVASSGFAAYLLVATILFTSHALQSRLEDGLPPLQTPRPLGLGFPLAFACVRRRLFIHPHFIHGCLAALATPLDTHLISFD